MPSTYTPIATQTLGSAAASVTFSSIANTYTDLILVAGLTSGTTDQTRLTFNGDSATNYSITSLYGDGSSAVSYRTTSVSWIDVGYLGAASTPNIIVQIMNYANTTTFKTILSRSNNAAGLVMATVGLWRKTPEAINSLTVTAQNVSGFATGSTFTLYGVKSA